MGKRKKKQNIKYEQLRANFLAETYNNQIAAKMTEKSLELDSKRKKDFGVI